MTRIEVQRLDLPDALLTCSPAPVPPGEGTTQRDVAGYVLDLWAAWADCSGKLSEVAGLVDAHLP